MRMGVLILNENSKIYFSSFSRAPFPCELTNGHTPTHTQHNRTQALGTLTLLYHAHDIALNLLCAPLSEYVFHCDGDLHLLQEDDLCAQTTARRPQRGKGKS